MLLVLALTFLLGTSAMAAELVVNGGFESGDFTGWTTAITNFTFVSNSVNVNPVTPISGTYSAWFGQFRTDATISQTLHTCPGDVYVISFDLGHFNPGTDFNNDFSVMFDGVTILTLSHQLAFGDTHYAAAVVATTNNTLLTIAGRDDPTFYVLDNVSCQGEVCSPLPGSLMLLGSGFLGLLGWRKIS